MKLSEAMETIIEARGKPTCFLCGSHVRFGVFWNGYSTDGGFNLTICHWCASSGKLGALIGDAIADAPRGTDGIDLLALPLRETAREGYRALSIVLVKERNAQLKLSD